MMNTPELNETDKVKTFQDARLISGNYLGVGGRRNTGTTQRRTVTRFLNLKQGVTFFYSVS